MSRFTRRTYLRRYLKAPIEFSGNVNDEGRQALVSDCCKEGMHFISDVYLEPGSIIWVRPCDQTSLLWDDERKTACQARVIWSRRCVKNKGEGFSIGVQFLADDQQPNA